MFLKKEVKFLSGHRESRVVSSPMGTSMTAAPTAALPQPRPL